MDNQELKAKLEAQLCPEHQQRVIVDSIFGHRVSLINCCCKDFETKVMNIAADEFTRRTVYEYDNRHKQ